MAQPLSPEELGDFFEKIAREPTGKLSKLAEIAQLNLAEDYIGADLSNENLSEDNLSGANFSNVNLSNTNLSGTNLSKADLSYANLSNADLRGANLSYANLSHAQIDDATKLDDKWRLAWKIVNQGTEGQNLSGVNLSNAHLSGANLSRANLTNANLSRANLSGANLSGADLSGANLSGANLMRANLIYAKLRHTNLSDANLSGADLSGADLSDAYLSDAYLSGAKIDDATKLDDKWRLVWQIVNHGTERQDLSGALIWGITGNKPAPKRKFLIIFSYNDQDEITDESTVIVIPTFPARITPEKVEVTNQSTSNALKQKATENLSRSVTKVAIENDVRASLSIESSFLKTLLPRPQISWDEEKINFDDPEKITYILIGLSNSQIDNLSEESITDKYFYIDAVTHEKYNFNSFMIKCGQFDDSNNLCSLDQWQLYREGDTFNYALFAKFKFGNKNIIVCGGITEECTNRAASYVSENWEYIYDELSTKKRGSLDPNDSFALVIRIPRDEQSKEFEIEQTCIRRIA